MSDDLKAFLTFRRMITPVLIQIVYWILTVIAVIGGLVLLVSGDGDERWGGLALLILGPIAVRLYAEIFMVIFRINETLTDIRDRGQQD